MVETGNGMNSGQTVMLGVATAITSMVISKLAGRVATAVAGATEQSEEEMYEKIYGHIDNAKFNFNSGPGMNVGRSVRVPTKKAIGLHRKQAKFDPDESPTMGYVQSALENLKEAKKSTQCGVCQRKIDSAIHAVETESELIVKTELKYGIINELKSHGRIPKNAGWNQLNPKQREFINKKVNEMMKNG
jgi:hypothetical protein